MPKVSRSHQHLPMKGGRRLHPVSSVQTTRRTDTSCSSVSSPPDPVEALRNTSTGHPVHMAVEALEFKLDLRRRLCRSPGFCELVTEVLAEAAVACPVGIDHIGAPQTGRGDVPGQHVVQNCQKAHRTPSFLLRDIDEQVGLAQQMSSEVRERMSKILAPAVVPTEVEGRLTIGTAGSPVGCMRVELQPELKTEYQVTPHRPTCHGPRATVT